MICGDKQRLKKSRVFSLLTDLDRAILHRVIVFVQIACGSGNTHTQGLGRPTALRYTTARGLRDARRHAPPLRAARQSAKKTRKHERRGCQRLVPLRFKRERSPCHLHYTHPPCTRKDLGKWRTEDTSSPQTPRPRGPRGDTISRPACHVHATPLDSRR
eukprot:5410627-Prymnesium_polylepis.1